MQSSSTKLFFDVKHPFIIAHRGLAIECRENTLQAFAKAISVGADIIEFDVRQTKDGSLVVFHDETIAGKLISSIDYAELRKTGLSEGLEIPTLEETLDFIGHRAFFTIEIKEVGYEIEAVNLILKHIETSRFLVISFHDKVIKRIKEMDYSIATGLLLGKENPKKLLLTRLSEIFPHHRLKKCHADFIIPHYKIARLWRYIRFISPKRNMVVWTVNEKKEMLKLFENKAAGIITDYSNIALKVRDDWKSKSV